MSSGAAVRRAAAVTGTSGCSTPRELEQREQREWQQQQQQHRQLHHGRLPRLACVRESFYAQQVPLGPDTSLSVLQRASGATVCLLLSLSPPVVSIRQLAELPAHVYLRLETTHAVPNLCELVHDATLVLAAVRKPTAAAGVHVAKAAPAPMAATAPGESRRSILDEIPLADTELIEDIGGVQHITRHSDCDVGMTARVACNDVPDLSECPDDTLIIEAPGKRTLSDSWEVLSDDAAVTTPSEMSPRATRLRSLTNSSLLSYDAAALPLALSGAHPAPMVTATPTTRSLHPSHASTPSASPMRSPTSSREALVPALTSTRVRVPAPATPGVMAVRHLPLSLLDAFEPEVMFALLSLRPAVKTLGDLAACPGYKLDKLCQDYQLSRPLLAQLQADASARIAAATAAAAAGGKTAA